MRRSRHDAVDKRERRVEHQPAQFRALGLDHQHIFRAEISQTILGNRLEFQSEVRREPSTNDGQSAGESVRR